jgi:membrane-associated phospholipid phosphatase
MKLGVLLAILFTTPSLTAQSPPLDRPVSWKLLFPNLVEDQKRIWSFPAHLVEGHSWIPATAVLGTTAALIALDPTEAGYFRGTSSFHGFNNALSGNATTVGIILVPVSLYAVGLIHKDSKMTHTALLAGEALADAEILSTVLKDVTNRRRPSAIPTTGNFSDSFFESPPRWQSTGGFPSGHAIAAFSVATVVAHRYGNHRWVPYVAYGAATLVGFSRLTLSAHFASDVFVGAALGYSISRFAVLRQ